MDVVMVVLEFLILIISNFSLINDNILIESIETILIEFIILLYSIYYYIYI